MLNLVFGLLNYRCKYLDVLNQKMVKKTLLAQHNILGTVTSCLFTHTVSTEKMRKDTRDCKDTRGTKYTYYIGCFLILLLVKYRLGTFPLLTICLFYL